MAGMTNLKTGVGQSAKEMNEFIAQLKGRSPADAMGIVARSHLLQALVISCIVQAAIVLGSTAYSYATRDTTPKVVTAPPVPTTAPVAPPVVSVSTPPANNTAATTANTTTAPDDPIKRVMNTDVVKPEDQKPKGPRDVEDLLKGSR